MSQIHVFTSAAANYLPKTRALFASLARHRPEWRRHLVLAEDADPEVARQAVGADEASALPSLGVPHWRSWAFCHSLVELATAIKPFALRRLLARQDCAAAIYLDPDIAVFSPLPEVAEALGDWNILLTPHQTQPERTVRGVIANEVCTLQHGVYNLGFIAVAARPEGRRFADWWASRTYQFCREDAPNGLYTDQRWIDLAPGLFEGVNVLRDAQLNVAPWNLSTRRMAGDPDRGLTVDGHPLGFFHFSAVDSGGFDALAPDPVVGAVLDWYRAAAAPRPGDPASADGWSLATFADGAPISRAQRLVYRLRGDLQQAYPNPYASGEASYQAWWRGQAPIEFPALFDPAAEAAEIARLGAALTTGFAPIDLL